MTIAALGALAVFAAPAGAVPRIVPASVPGNVVCTTDQDLVTPGVQLGLTADDGRIQTPDGNSLYMWGYVPAGGGFQIPGPVLCVTEGDLVEITLTNNLPANNSPSDVGPDVGPDNTSLVFPGQSGVTATGGAVDGPLAREAAPGGSVSYAFTAGRPGTYLYESGTEPSKQIEMGLYGAIIVRPLLGPNYAYNDLTTVFDPEQEYILILHDMDSDLHHSVDRGQGFDITLKHDRYWTVNGRSFPDTIADSGVPWLPTQPYGSLVWVERRNQADTAPSALIRYANAGLSNHPFHPHGNHSRVIARDGALLTGPLGQDGSMEAFTKTIGSGQTYEILFRFDDDEGYSSASPVQFQGQDVVFPGLLNLVFKDDLTFYGGSPYLGETDELPPRVTTLNECGEFYFPWHSHALNEFQNFDEGFGGLATLLRVDPPGGCGPGGASATGPAPARVAAAVTVTAKASVRGQRVSFQARTARCAPCKATVRMKVRGVWRTLTMTRVRANTYSAVATNVPRSRVTYYAAARDLDSGRRATSAWQQVRVGAAALVTFDLCADEGSTTLPDATVVPVWGFALNPGGVCGAVTRPGGPTLEVEAGDIVTVNLTNNLDTENASLVFPGHTLAPDFDGVPPGGTASYTFTASNSGAFLYESGVNPFQQHLMGLFGALVVRPALLPGQAYADPTTAFDVEQVMVLSELDVQFNNGVAGLGAPVGPGDYDPEYWLINGQAYPAVPSISAAPGSRVLLRYLNAGQEHHTMTLLGLRQRIIARDSFQPVVTPDVIAETIAAGSTGDAIATVPLTALPGASFPLYSRQLAVTNGPVWPGGMLTFITVP